MSNSTLFDARMPQAEVSPSSAARRLLLRVIFEAGAIILLLLGLPLLLIFFLSAPFPYTTIIFLLPTTLFYFKLVRKVRRKGKQYSAMRYTTVDGAERLSRDKRRPILYLRSFLEETPHDPLRDDFRTEEELLDSVLKEVGPMVAIGRPGEPLPPLGASRYYFKDDEWREEVQKLMERAQFIVIKPGLAENLRWEIRTASKLCPPQKLLFPLLEYQTRGGNFRERNYKPFRRIIQDEMGVTLPEDIGTATFLSFEKEDGKTVPYFSWPVTWADKPRRSLSNRFLGDDRVPLAIREALRPIMARRGIHFSEWTEAVSTSVAFFTRLLPALIILLLFLIWLVINVYLRAQNNLRLITTPPAADTRCPGRARCDASGRRHDYSRPEALKTLSTAFMTRSTGTRRMHSGASNSAQV